MANPLVSIKADVSRARVRFTEFRSQEDPMLQAWARFRSTLTAAPMPERPQVRTAPSVGAASGLWRLLATNNRELGRSFLLYSRFEAARAHVTHLQAAPDALTIEHFSGPGNGSRAWILMAAGVPVMTCSRWYSSLSGAAAAAEGALSAFRSAVVADAPDRSDASGRFRRRAPLDEHVRAR